MVSISSTSTDATHQAAAFSLISVARAPAKSHPAFRIVDTGYARAGLQDDRGSGNRPRKRTHSCLVDAGDGMLPLIPEKRFEAQHLAKPLSFRPVLKAPFLNGGKDSPRARASVGAQDFLKARLKRFAFDDVTLT